jgi:hypothetical protein
MIVKDIQTEVHSNDISNILLIGITSSLMATFIYFILRQLIRPKIKIFDKVVVRNRISPDGKNEIVSSLKMVNKCFFSIEDVKFRLYLMKEVAAGNNKNIRGKIIDLKIDNYSAIVGLNRRSKTHYENCVLINVHGDIREQLKGENTSLRLQICATHSKSGFKRVHTKNFIDVNHFLELGYFDSGEKEKIISKELEN